MSSTSISDSGHTEKLSYDGQDVGSNDVESSLSPADELKRIQRRIDLHIMPWLCVTYLVMRIDATNISNAAIMNLEQGHGIKQQLSLTAQQWTWVLACFSYTYGGLEPFSTLLMKRTTPSFWLGRIMISWGIIVCCIAAVQNYAGLIAVRVLLGAAEAGFYPCIIYYLAFWFRPEELVVRIALFYSFGLISGFVGGFLAFAVSFADGVLAGWQWLFIIEGVPAVLMGFITLYILPDYPQSAKFLNDREKAILLERLSDGAPSSESRTWDIKQAKHLFTSPSFWSFSLVWFCHSIGGFGVAFVLPTVIYDLGFTTTALSNALTMPPSLAAFIVLNVLGWLVQNRNFNPFRVAIGLEFVNIIACILLLTVKVTVVRYLCLVVATGTAGSVYPILWPSRVRAAHGTTAAGLAIGVTNAIAQFAGILGPQVFKSTFGPSYRVSFLVCVGLLAGAIISIIVSGLLVGELYQSKKPTTVGDEVGKSVENT